MMRRGPMLMMYPGLPMLMMYPGLPILMMYPDLPLVPRTTTFEEQSVKYYKLYVFRKLFV